MNVFEQATIWWVIAFAVGIPLSMVVLTEVIGFLQQRSHPAVGPLKLLRNWVIPVAGLLVLLTFAAEPAMRYLDRTAEALTQNSVYIGKVMTTAPTGTGTE